MSATEEEKKRRVNGPDHASGHTTAILLVERDNDLRRVIAASLSINDWEVIQANSLASATNKVEDGDVDLLLLGIESSSEKNIRLVRTFRQVDGGERGGLVLLMTSERIKEEWRERLKPDAVVYKPFDMRFLCERIEGLLRDAQGAI
jgi:DNA-binding response OmpR family regulator